MTLLAFKMTKGATSKECGQPVAAGRGTETGSSLEPPEGNGTLLTPGLKSADFRS